MTSELRIPADPAYIVVAKRTAAAFGSVHGLGIEGIDDLTIAVAQACQILIEALHRTVGPGGQIRLGFATWEGRLEVRIRGHRGRHEAGAERRLPAASAPERAAAYPPAAAEADAEAAAVVAMRARAMDEAASADLALRLVGLFVDDCRYRMDQRTGGLHVRLTKFRSA